MYYGLYYIVDAPLSYLAYVKELPQWQSVKRIIILFVESEFLAIFYLRKELER